MTCIVSFNTKKELIEATKAGKDFYIEDPSMFNPRIFSLSELKIGEHIAVTNHPKRSWFANIERTETGVKIK